ncbi:hypothetical protein Tco_0242642 [Tanacetum coccineum]
MGSVDTCLYPIALGFLFVDLYKYPYVFIVLLFDFLLCFSLFFNSKYPTPLPYICSSSARALLVIGTDIAKIARKRSKPDKHGHGNGKSAQEPEVF